MEEGPVWLVSKGQGRAKEMVEDHCSGGLKRKRSRK